MARVKHNYEKLCPECVALYTAGLSTHAVAKQLGVSQGSVVIALDRAGCALRSPSASLKMVGCGRKVTDEQIVAALKTTNGVRKRAAATLGISTVALHYRLQKSIQLMDALLAARRLA
jgi:DNA-binding NtrC family response regulator